MIQLCEYTLHLDGYEQALAKTSALRMLSGLDFDMPTGPCARDGQVGVDDEDSDQGGVARVVEAVQAGA